MFLDHTFLERYVNAGSPLPDLWVRPLRSLVPVHCRYFGKFRHMRYLFTPYIVLNVALIGSLAKNWDSNNSNSIFTVGLLAICGCKLIRTRAIITQVKAGGYFVLKIFFGALLAAVHTESLLPLAVASVMKILLAVQRTRRTPLYSPVPWTCRNHLWQYWTKSHHICWTAFECAAYFLAKSNKVVHVLQTNAQVCKQSSLVTLNCSVVDSWSVLPCLVAGLGAEFSELVCCVYIFARLHTTFCIHLLVYDTNYITTQVEKNWICCAFTRVVALWQKKKCASQRITVRWNLHGQSRVVLVEPTLKFCWVKQKSTRKKSTSAPAWTSTGWETRVENRLNSSCPDKKKVVIWRFLVAWNFPRHEYHTEMRSSIWMCTGCKVLDSTQNISYTQQSTLTRWFENHALWDDKNFCDGKASITNSFIFHSVDTKHGFVPK